MADGRLSNTIVAASWLTLLSLIAIVISFATPYWLETDGTLDNPKFVKLGKHCVTIGMATPQGLE